MPHERERTVCMFAGNEARLMRLSECASAYTRVLHFEPIEKSVATSVKILGAKY